MKPFSLRPVVLLALAAILTLAACVAPPPPVVAPTPSDAPPGVGQLAAPPLAAPQSAPRESLALGVPKSGGEVIVDGTPPPFNTFEFSTNFARRTVEWNKILSGGPPKDGIPAIDAPEFESIAVGNEWLDDREPVILFQHGETARAYPLSILIWHEIVNDEVDGQPVSVTFCPLCNASITFDRNFDGQVLDFGTTGRLRNSDLIMYDRQTETWWQQFTGEGIVGEYAGEQLTFLPSQVITWGDFKTRFPDAQVLARPQRNGRFARSYGMNPYVSYDSTSNPFLFLGDLDERLPPVERVAGLTTETTARAYPFALLAENGVVEDTFDGRPIVLFHRPGATSALDARQISEGKDVGAVAVYARTLNGEVLSFRADGQGNFIDNGTESTWNILGEAVAGPLAGSRLTEILHFDHFWFAWAAFFPNTELYGE